MCAFFLARAERIVMPTPYQLMGGQAGADRLVDAFYDVLEAEPAYGPLRARHPADLAPLREGMRAWMGAWLGRPRHGARPDRAAPCILALHAATPFDAAAAELWMAAMRHAFVRADLSHDLVELITPELALVCEGLRSDYGAARALPPGNAA
jgi:hemoglobin